MINFPYLSASKNKSAKYSYAFGGINKGEAYSFGELETSENISFLSYPALSGAPVWNTASLTQSEPDDVLFFGDILTIKDQKAIYSKGTNPLVYITSHSVSSGQKESATVGNFIVIYPDKIYYNRKTYAWGNSDETLSLDDQNFYFGNDYIRFKQSVDYQSFKNKFSEGDTIKINGGVYADNNRATVISETLTIREFEKDTQKVFFDPNSFGVTSERSGAQTSFERKCPELKNITSHGGRLWGTEGSEIKASKYQNPNNFDFYELSAADSYTVETAEGENFTASYSMGDYVLFFKENTIYRISGTKPANFRLTTIRGKGVKSGCERSLAQTGGVLYYMAADGVYAFAGAEAEKISAPIGDLSDVVSAAAGFFGSVYYISLKRKNGEYETFGYDTKKGTWLRESSEGVLAFGEIGGELWKFSADKKIYKRSSENEREKNFSATLRKWDENKFNQKGYSRFYLKYMIENGGYIKVETAVNSEPFKTSAILSDSRKTVSEIRLAPSRGDSVGIRLSVFGGGKILGIVREYFLHGSAF